MRSRTRIRSFGLSHDLCSVLECLFERFQVCDRFSFVSPRFWLHLFTHKRIPASFEQWQHGEHIISQNTRIHWILARHAQIRWLVSCPSRVIFNAVVVQQRRAATRLLCNCQDTGILTPQWPPCTCDLQSTVIACVSVFCCFWHSTRMPFMHATAFTDHRIHSL